MREHRLTDADADVDPLAGSPVAYSLEASVLKHRSRTILVTDRDEERLGVVLHAYPLVSRHRLAQVAYRFGIRTMAHEPERVLEEAVREAQDVTDVAAGGTR